MAQTWDQRLADVMKTFSPFCGFLLGEIIKDGFFQVLNAPLDPLRLTKRFIYGSVQKLPSPRLDLSYSHCCFSTSNTLSPFLSVSLSLFVQGWIVGPLEVPPSGKLILLSPIRAPPHTHTHTLFTLQRTLHANQPNNDVILCPRYYGHHQIEWGTILGNRSKCLLYFTKGNAQSGGYFLTKGGRFESWFGLSVWPQVFCRTCGRLYHRQPLVLFYYRNRALYICLGSHVCFPHQFSRTERYWKINRTCEDF